MNCLIAVPRIKKKDLFTKLLFITNRIHRNLLITSCNNHENNKSLCLCELELSLNV